MSNPEFLILQIGQAGSLDDHSLSVAIQNTLATLIRVSPMTGVSVCIGGYDDDPRELHEIPEAREFILNWAANLMHIGVQLDRFMPDTLNLVQTCMAAFERMPVVVIDKEIDMVGELEAYQARVRRKMQ